MWVDCLKKGPAGGNPWKKSRGMRPGGVATKRGGEKKRKKKVFTT